MKNLNWLKDTLIAHRGLHLQDLSVPENSLKAFKDAIALGYGIELDLNLLKDNTIVSFHDGNLKRLTNDPRKLKKVTYQEIKDLKLHNTNEHIPTLSDVLNLIDSRVPLLIELKSHGRIKTFCKLFYEQMKDYKGKWAVFSFDPRVVGWFKKHAPNVIRGQIAGSNKATILRPLSYMLRTMFFNRFTKPDFISYNVLNLPYKPVDKAQAKGICIIGYVARNQSQLDFMRTHYSNLVFEFFIPKEI